MSYALLRDGDRLLVPPMMLFAVYLLMAGHNRPGGGFVAGLTMASAVVLRGQARGATEALRMIRLTPLSLLATGLLLAVAVGGALMVLGEGFLSMTFTEIVVPVFGTVKLTSAFPFDVGVALLVVGVVAAIVEAFGEEVPE
ncbi:Na+/H+ antiporter subunit B [soil metagenome]